MDHASQLNLPPERVHSSVAQHDIIKLTNMDKIGLDPLGPDPTKPEFGGSTFTSSPGTKGPDLTAGLSAQAHSEYWNKDSASLANIGNIVAGKPTY